MQKVPSTSGITDYQVFLFKEGTNYNTYKMLGCNCIKGDEADGTPGGFRFSVWAPNAAAVSLVGDFNNWAAGANPMKELGDSGIWFLFMPDLKEGVTYKYAIKQRNGTTVLKSDPFAFYSELRPHTASITFDLSRLAGVTKPVKNTGDSPYDKPMLIYELHAGSWKQHSNGAFLTYTELAEELIPYLTDMNYTHVELMPVTEHPFDGSWGYQTTGYFCATSRYGRPEELKYFIDRCHKSGIGVILDWVPSHFTKDSHGLARFDGTCLYEYEDPLLGEQPQWDTLVFDYGKKEVQSFLLSSAFFWLDVYQADGLRVDAVSSMLYLDYGRLDGKWLKNKYGGNTNLEAKVFLQNLNSVIFSQFPYALMIAEEATSWPGVTTPVHEGGLGFNYKWNMGWMNDSLKYLSMDPLLRKYNHDLLTFTLVYAFSENYILPLSHDEVVHGKKSMINKIPGSYEEKFSTLRAFYALMMALPGKKLFFMGAEFGQFIEWRFDYGLDWLLLGYDAHKKLQYFMKTLNNIYKRNKSLYQLERSWEGFKWINEKDKERSVISFLRRGKSKSEYIICICNFTPVRRESYIIGVPAEGTYYELINTDSELFGGQEKEPREYGTRRLRADGCKYAIELDLPSLAAIYLRKKKHTKNNQG